MAAKTTRKRRQRPHLPFCDECLIQPAVQRNPQGNLCRKCLNGGESIINASDGEEVETHA
jgi:hypothetical protein